MLLSLAGTLILLVAAGFFAWDRHQMCVATIEGSLRRFHARNIKIAFDWFDFDRDTFTYDVECTDADGRRHANRCKVKASPGVGDEAIYWQHPLTDTAAPRRLT